MSGKITSVSERVSKVLLDQRITSVDELIASWNNLGEFDFTKNDYVQAYQYLSGHEEERCTSNIKVRASRSRDYPRIEELRQYLAGYTAVPENLGTLAEEASCQVAVLDRQIVGYVLYEEDYGATQIREVVADEKYRGQGVMEALFGKVETEQPLVLRVNNHNYRALKAFEKYGFELVDTEGDYHLMQKVPGFIVNLF